MRRAWIAVLGCLLVVSAPRPATAQPAADVAFDTVRVHGIEMAYREVGEGEPLVLLHMATGRPERVERMVLVGATSYFPESAREIMRSMDPDSAPAERGPRAADPPRAGQGPVRRGRSELPRGRMGVGVPAS